MAGNHLILPLERVLGAAGGVGWASPLAATCIHGVCQQREVFLSSGLRRRWGGHDHRFLGLVRLDFAP
jgi:hypothetical protein